MDVTEKRENNGVDLANVQQLVEAVKDNRNLANVTFEAKSRWVGGTKSEVTISDLYAGGQNIARADRRFQLTVDEPAQLGGTDQAPNPVEHLAAGLAGCLTAGIATNSALFGVELEKLEIDVSATYDILGLLGLDRSVPTEASEIKYTVRIKGSGGADALQRSKETIDRKSPVRNTIARAINVTTEIIVEE